MKKITVQMTTLDTDNEQTGMNPRVSAAGSYTSRPYMEFAKAARALFMLDVSAISGAPTLDLKIEGKDETADIWRTVATFPQQTGINHAIVPIEVNPLYYTQLRASWTVAGTSTPSVTFSLQALANSEVGS